jgi:uroporphyrin-3 C-methyltransferase
MSNDDKSDETDLAATAQDAAESSIPESEAVDDAATGQADESVADAKAAPESPVRPVKKNGAIAWLALLLALISLGSGGYLLVKDWRAARLADTTSGAVSGSIARLDGRIDSSAQMLADLERKLGEVAAANKGAITEVDALQRGLGGRMDLLDSVAPRLSTLENALAALQGVSTGARDTWLLAEAEYYMQIANAQLQLAGNPDLAALALGMADERVVQLADPALTEVRQTIADELAALDVLVKPDIEGVTLTLSSLARVIGSLPLRNAGSDAAAEQAVDATSSGVERAWNSVKTAVAGLIKVTPPDEGRLPLIPPEAAYFLRTNLTVQLQAARLALLRGEQAVFEQSLDDASAWLRDHFDTGSAQVTGALQTIGEIRDGLFGVTPPDISGSLRLLRQYKTLAETAR